MSRHFSSPDLYKIEVCEVFAVVELHTVKDKFAFQGKKQPAGCEGYVA